MFFCFFDGNFTDWIPAFAGMTNLKGFQETQVKSIKKMDSGVRRNDDP